MSVRATKTVKIVLVGHFVFSEDPWVALHHNFLTKAELKEANAEIQDFEFGQVHLHVCTE